MSKYDTVPIVDYQDTPEGVSLAILQALRPEAITFVAMGKVLFDSLQEEGIDVTEAGQRWVDTVNGLANVMLRDYFKDQMMRPASEKPNTD